MKLFLPVLVLASALLPWGIPAQDSSATRPTVTLGVFDSRAVAIAHVRSDALSARLKDLHQQLADAREAGDEKRVAELEAYGPALQKKIHRQGFGTAPIDDILETIQDDLPGIAAEAGVDVLVSRWDIAWKSDRAAAIDVTQRMVALFEPDEETLRVIADVRSKRPVADDKLDDHDH